MSYYYGDYPASHTAVCMDFDSFAGSTGAPSATSNFAAGDIQIYKDGGTTQRSSSAGITVSTSFDSLAGLQMIVIDLSNNTDAGFYAAGHEYNVAVADVTIDSQTMRFWVGSFSIERAGGVLALAKSATSGFEALKTLIDTVDDFVDTEVAAIKAKTDLIPAAPASTTNITAASGVALTSAYDFAKGTVAVTESYNTDGAAPTPVQALMMIMQMLTEKSVASTTLTVKKLDGSTSAAVFTLNDSVSPTSITRAS